LTFQVQATHSTLVRLSVRSIKSVSELYAPVTGEIVEVNDSLDDSPETVNQDAHGEGWMIKVKLADVSEIEALMDADAYDAFLAEA
jgi:glycine cleavage system H protein